MSDYSMSESEREKAFPIHIDLGRKESGMAMPAMPAGAKKGKARTYYPTVYIDAIPGLEQLPKEGCMLVEFRRKRLSIEEGADGEDTAGVTLEIRALCLPEEMAEEAMDDLASALDRVANGTKDETDYEDEEE